MKLLPVALNVNGKRCLVIGGGMVALRKVASLLECGARVTVIAPELTPELAAMSPSVSHLPRAFQQGDCAGYQLVFACTDCMDVNAQVAHEAHEHGAWCNVADDAEAGDFHSAAAVRRGEICIGIGTTGGSPALARHLRERIEASIGPEYEQLLDIMSAHRALAKAAMAKPGERAALWRAVLTSDTLDLLREGRRDEAEARVERLVTGRDT